MTSDSTKNNVFITFHYKYLAQNSHLSAFHVCNWGLCPFLTGPGTQHNHIILILSKLISPLIIDVQVGVITVVLRLVSSHPHSSARLDTLALLGFLLVIIIVLLGLLHFSWGHHGSLY